MFDSGLHASLCSLFGKPWQRMADQSYDIQMESIAPPRDVTQLDQQLAVTKTAESDSPSSLEKLKAVINNLAVYTLAASYLTSLSLLAVPSLMIYAAFSQAIFLCIVTLWATYFIIDVVSPTLSAAMPHPKTA